MAKKRKAKGGSVRNTPTPRISRENISTGKEQRLIREEMNKMRREQMEESMKEQMGILDELSELEHKGTNERMAYMEKIRKMSMNGLIPTFHKPKLEMGRGGRPSKQEVAKKVARSKRTVDPSTPAKPGYFTNLAKWRKRNKKGDGGDVEMASGGKLYYFEGRNTGVHASSASEARKKKRRGGDKIVATRTPKPGEFKGGWSRIRKDGKSPEKSKYGKGRGYGPPRKATGGPTTGIVPAAEPMASDPPGGIDPGNPYTTPHPGANPMPSEGPNQRREMYYKMFPFAQEMNWAMIENNANSYLENPKGYPERKVYADAWEHRNALMPADKEAWNQFMGYYHENTYAKGGRVKKKKKKKEEMSVMPNLDILDDAVDMARGGWIKDAIKRPGAFKKKAKRAGMSTAQYANKVKNDPRASTRTKRQAALARTLKKMRKKS